MGKELGVALCLVLVIEGILPFLAPARYRYMAFTLAQTNDRTIRIIGLGSMLTGTLMLYLLR